MIKKKNKASEFDQDDHINDEFWAEAEKRFGKGILMKHDSILYSEVVSTGSIALDHIIGGGVPMGRIIEFYGLESSGKTTLALHIVREFQKRRSKCVYIDLENCLNMKYMSDIGVDIKELIISQPSNAEEVFSLIEFLVVSGKIGLIILDSVAALVPKEEIEGSIGDQTIGLQARIISKGLRRLINIMQKNSECTIIFINQLRSKVSTGFTPYGAPTETTTGGNALKYYASLRLEIKKRAVILENNDIVGNLINIKVVKNKVAPPFKTITIGHYYAYGFSQAYEIMHYGNKTNLIKQNGSWFTYGETKLGQGLNNCVKILEENKDLLEELIAAFKVHIQNIYSLE